MNEPAGSAPQAGAPAPSAALSADLGLESILSEAFAAFKARFGSVLGCFVVFAVLQAVCGKFSLLALLAAPHLIVGFSMVLLKALRGREPAFSDLFKGFSYYIPVLAAGLLMGLLLPIAFICLVVPGVILGLMWSQTMFLLAEDILAVEAGRKDKASLSGWGAMQRSAALMSGHKLRLLGIAVVLAIIGISGALAVGIGALITMPFAWLAFAAFYNRLATPAS
jgi:hypothetical protein